MNTLRGVNLALQEHKGHYPRDERAGFNFMRDMVKMLEALEVNEIEFLSGMLTVITLRLRRVKDGKDMPDDGADERSGQGGN